MAPSLRVLDCKSKRKHSSLWTWQAEVTLVNFVRKRRFLWYPRDKSFFNKTKKDSAFEELATSLGPMYSASTVKDRWSNIRSTFMVNHKKARENPARDGEEGFVPSWPLYNHLLFLKEAHYVRTSHLYHLHHVGNSASKGMNDSPAMDNDALTDDGDCKEAVWKEIMEAIPSESAKASCSSGASTPQQTLALHRPATPHRSASTEPSEVSASNFSWVVDRSKLPQDHHRPLQESTRELNNCSAKSPSSTRDACDSFGAVVAASLRDMHTFHRACAQMEIQQILVKYNPENPEILSGVAMY